MSGIFQITVEEERGFTAVSADLDRLAVVMGPSSAGSGLSSFFLSGSSAIANRGYGDAVDALTQIIEQRQSSGSAVKFPAAMYTVPGDTPGSYGTIDVSGITGLATVAVDAASLPYGTYEAWLRIMAAGIVGVAGITLQWSLDGGRTWSKTTALGTADFFTLPNSNAKFTFSPSSTNLTALNTLINEEFGDFNAHVVLTTGTVHGVADNADVVSAVTYPVASNTATRVARMNALRAAYILHIAKTAGPVHLAADAVNYLLVGPCTDDSSCLALALDFKRALNLHDAYLTSHTIADATNVVTSAAPTAGSLNVGDIAKVRTFAPAPSTSDVDDAFVALAASSIDFALIVLEFPCDAAMAAHVTTGLNALLAVGKRVTAIVRARLPDFETGETEIEWGTDISDDTRDFDDSRIHRRETYGLITDAVTTRQYLRSDLAQFAADAVRVGRFAWPCAPADRATPNFTLVDSSGATVGHDEGPRGVFTGLSNETLGNRGGCQQRLPDPTRREDVFNTAPWVLYAADERIRNLMTRRLMNAMARVAVAAGTPKLGSKVFWVSTGPGAGTLKASSRNALQGSIYQAVSTEFADEIENAGDAAIDSGLVQVASGVTVTGGNLLGISFTLAPRVGGFVLTESFTLAVQE